MADKYSIEIVLTVLTDQQIKSLRTTIADILYSADEIEEVNLETMTADYLEIHTK